MVSSVLDLETDELVAELARIGKAHAADPDYRKLRSTLPADWPF